MKPVFSSFERKHDYLICVDSDGCVMDTMNCKHIHCFGPCMVDEWGLQQWEQEILRRWNEINLFRMTRGINRFKALAMMLGEVNEKYTPIIGLEALLTWVENAPALSNDEIALAVEASTDADGCICLQKALLWSLAVNESITKLPEKLKLPFYGVSDALEAAAQFVDVAVVSGANRDAVEEEWEKHGLLRYADILLAQDCGSTNYCIARMLRYGYEKDHVLMVGDAPEDCAAAEENGVLFYPILVNWEEESWAEFRETTLPMLFAGEYGSCQAEKKQVFIENLGG